MVHGDAGRPEGAGCVYWLADPGHSRKGYGHRVLPGVFAFALSGYQTPAELLAAGFGSTGLLQFLYAFLLTGAFTRSGAGEVVVRWALSRKALNGRPMLFMLVWWTAMTILGALTTNVVACMMLGFSLIASIAKVVGYDIKDSWCRFMIAGTVLVGGTAGVLIPFQGVPTMSLTVLISMPSRRGCWWIAVPM